MIASRPAGAAWLLDGLWQALDVDAALRKVLGGRRFTTDVERVLFALVANRAIDPSSKLAAADWASHDVAIPGLQGMDDDQAYRAMDLLIEADTDARCRRRCSSPSRTCSTSRSTCCSSTPPVPTSNATAPTRRTTAPVRRSAGTGTPRTIVRICRRSSSGWRSPAKASRCAAGAGRATPTTRPILPEVRDGLRGWRLGRVVTVVDRGFSSREPGLPATGRRALHRRRTDARRQPARRRGALPPGPLPAGPGQPAGQGSPDRLHTGHPVDHLPQPRRSRTRPGPARRRRDHTGSTEPPLAPEPRAARTAAPPTTSKAARRRADQQAEREEAAHVKAECALREHPALGRWLRQTPVRAAATRPGQDRRRGSWTASTCCRPRTRTCRPRTSRWATRTCWRPNAGSAT